MKETGGLTGWGAAVLQHEWRRGLGLVGTQACQLCPSIHTISPFIHTNQSSEVLLKDSCWQMQKYWTDQWRPRKTMPKASFKIWSLPGLGKKAGGRRSVISWSLGAWRGKNHKPTTSSFILYGFLPALGWTYSKEWPCWTWATVQSNLIHC